MSDDDAEQARMQLRALALELHGKSVDKHVEGMALSRRAARVEQLSEVATDAQAIRFRDALIEEGLLVVLPAINSPSGDA